ncbi:hypothetical protein A9Q84_13515 [Halobacteriovorax marinus]|uniref:Uncharacterized protein n=1 Tax=Halobacteriovorax marinus TaxID=97084 RepID=A0A1Y5F8R5_9BACT|nr:hypothetical protein A9Q84_13515 [Halobacteriovorax marinus]
MSVKVLVLRGDGLNCENETAFAFSKHGATCSIVHVNDLLENKKLLLEHDIFVVPGGFSFGDDLGSGRVLSLKLKMGLKEELTQFAKEERPILGICNGVQVLMKMGLLPDKKFVQSATLDKNIDGKFINKWSDLVVNSELCKWVPSELKSVTMPIRHGEGRFIFSDSSVANEIVTNNQAVFTYKSNPNGSTHDIAGICDPSGTILGLMPHPEAAIDTNSTPLGIDSSNDTNIIFHTILKYVTERKSNEFKSIN